MAEDTRTRILAATTRLLTRQGLAGTGLKQIAREAGAPFGSIYHFFPGGKVQLAEEAIRAAGAAYGEHALGVLSQYRDFPTAVEHAFAAAAANLVACDYADACPIATVALEVAGTDETLRMATADVFTSWIDAGVGHLADSGLSRATRKRLILGFIAALEGAFLLARALRSTEPLTAAGRTVADAARTELQRKPVRRGAAPDPRRG